jgi:nicotinamidase-related amidase
MVRGLKAGQKAAVVINELQRGVAGDLNIFPALSTQVVRRGIIPHIAALAAAFRALALPVVHCHIVHARILLVSPSTICRWPIHARRPC